MSSTASCFKILVSGFIVVSQSCSGIISPKPAKSKMILAIKLLIWSYVKDSAYTSFFLCINIFTFEPLNAVGSDCREVCCNLFKVCIILAILCLLSPLNLVVFQREYI